MSPTATSIQDYEGVLAARRIAYAEHLKAAHVDPALKAWAERMAVRDGPTVKVWHNDLPWLEALMVVRYGEAVEHWPSATTIADWGRATDWEAGKEIPFAVVRAATMNLSGKE